jgi:hypothetical protein
MTVQLRDFHSLWVLMTSALMSAVLPHLESNSLIHNVTQVNSRLLVGGYVVSRHSMLVKA